MTAPVTPILLTALQTGLSITSNTAPSLGSINVYNASAGSLVVTLPAVFGLNVGAIAQVEKDTLDTSSNSITFNRNGGDTFTDGSISYVLTRPGWYATLQVVNVLGQKYWKVIGQGGPASIDDTAAVPNVVQVNQILFGSNSSYVADVMEIAAGSSYEIAVNSVLEIG